MEALIENQKGTTDSLGKFISIEHPKMPEDELVYP